MLSLHHIGETLVVALLERTQLANKLESIRCARNGCKSTFGSVLQAAGLLGTVRFRCEAPLAPMKGKIFDGAHKVDCLAFDEKPDHAAIAVEVKLGEKGLGKGNVDDWLKHCDWSNHPTRRISGNMLAFLEGVRPPTRDDEPDLTAEPLTVQAEESQQRAVFGHWWLVTRQRRWPHWTSQNDRTPNFSPRAHAVSVESLIETACGRDNFDNFVYDLIGSDFFRCWKLG